jgi:hypothetical protein
MGRGIVILVVMLLAAVLAWWAQPGEPPVTPDAGVADASRSRDGDDVESDDGDQEDPPLPEPEPPFNPGWIGASCAADTDCDFPGGFCLTQDAGLPRGHCTQLCDGTCPRRKGDHWSDTLCVPASDTDTSGLCLARCALQLGSTGCRPGYVCATTPRFKSPGYERLACLPDRGTPPPETGCTAALKELGLTFGRPDIVDGETRLTRGGRTLPETCVVDTPVLLASPIHGVDYRESGRRLAENLMVSCRMALALERLSRLLAQLDVVEVEHVGTYNCRGVSGTAQLSAHARGEALDVRGFERAVGSPVSVEADWNGPVWERREYVRGVTRAIKQSGVFDVVMTPDTNAAHRDHLHLELRLPRP